MREIVIDTETTGLDPFTGDRIVEIGGVELENHIPTGRTYHQYINPERDMPQGAFDVHGLSIDFLKEYPVFKDIVHDFLSFVADAKLVIHNASFDMKFLNAELDWSNNTKLSWERAIDTLDMARRKFPGAQNTLDGLSRRFGINIERELHGALIDSKILAAVYLELIGGRQPDFALGIVGGTDSLNNQRAAHWKPKPRPKRLPSRITEVEKENHKNFVEKLGPEALWLNF